MPLPTPGWAPGTPGPLCCWEPGEAKQSPSLWESYHLNPVLDAPLKGFRPRGGGGPGVPSAASVCWGAAALTRWN